MTRGLLRLHVLVGAAGRAKEVRKAGNFDDDVMRYQPAVCHGQPCDMLYPIAMDITHRM